MLLIALRDLQFRKRRFVVSTVAVGLVFALTLVLAALASSFDREVQATLDTVGADTYLVAAGATGPFIGAAPLPKTAADGLDDVPGIERASGIAFRTLVLDDDARTRINGFGVEPGGVGSPAPNEGRGLEANGEAVVDQRVPAGIGETLTIAGSQFTVVGLLHDSTLIGGGPNAFLTLEDLDKVGFAGAPIITAVAVKGRPSGVPPDFEVVDRAGAVDDLVRPLDAAKGALQFMSVLLWLVAGTIMGSVVYLSASERIRDFAALKAMGVHTGSIIGGLALQSLIVCLIASVLATGLGFLLAPVFPIPVQIQGSAVATLPVIAAVIGVLASGAAARRAVGVDPSVAFGAA
jgi:putative ABC transport system permease protein